MNFFNLPDDLGLLNELWEKIHVRGSFVNCSIRQKKLNTTPYTPYAGKFSQDHRPIDIYKMKAQNKRNKNTVGFVTSETKFSAEHRNKPGVLICMLHRGDFTSENKTSYQRRGQK